MAQGNSGRWSLQGMTTLVTGGTKGIGHAIVEEYWPDSGQPCTLALETKITSINAYMNGR
ncbi:hypothetical protein SLEP1_g14737 [Rubroshorea leprosula]|uniref:Uncharacterized protein n=1 Tax=Rubroshorea leprosula TaxID=152421 RepID=A0AAV5ITX9_9ROSI|nr:hypothetical protein SLEP1_g14737 [Rubroshorea leprosula]